MKPALTIKPLCLALGMMLTATAGAAIAEEPERNACFDQTWWPGEIGLIR